VVKGSHEKASIGLTESETKPRRVLLDKTTPLNEALGTSSRQRYALYSELVRADSGTFINDIGGRDAE